MHKNFYQISNKTALTEIQRRLKLLRAEIKVKMALMDELIEEWEILELTKSSNNGEKDYEEEAN